MFRSVLAIYAVVLGAGVMPTAASAAPDADAPPAVTELALSGVAPDEVPELPATPPAPSDDVTTQGPQADPGPAAEPDVLTAPRLTDDFSVLGFTWSSSDADDVVVRYRLHSDEGWSEWEAVAEGDAAPDPDSTEGRRTHRRGSDPVIALNSDGLQVWAESSEGPVTALKAVLVDAPSTEVSAAEPTISGASLRTEASASRSQIARATTSALTTAAPGRPGIITRAEWGADESLRTCTPDYSSTGFVSAAVHHTDSANDYSPADVPRILNGILAFHTRPESAGGRGWCDIGYNFLVDRFGRVFEGRGGSIDTTVIGVHTGGFNSRTIGIAAIGTFTTTGPSAELLEALSQLIAWRFSTFGIRAGDTVQMVSGGGASKYPDGTVVSFPTIYGHRDAQLTACPGQSLYDSLPAIRGRVAQLVNDTVGVSPRGTIDQVRGTGSGVAVTGWAYDRGTDAPVDVAVSIDGAAGVVRADAYRPDVAAAFGVGPNHGFAGTVAASAGTHLVCLTVRNTGEGADVSIGCQFVTTNRPPFGRVDVIEPVPGGVHVNGWAIDPDTNDPVDVHVYVDGAGTATRAALPRPDVDAAHHAGAAHGFDLTIPTPQGSHQVCVYPINTPSGPNPPLGCRTITVGASPVGAIDVVGALSGWIVVQGWALDPDTSASIQTHVYVDGVGTPTIANASRPDVGAAFGKGDAHGFALWLPATNGPHDVCVWAIDGTGGPNSLLGCRRLTVVNRAPIGALDVATRTGGIVHLSGWAMDPDTSTSVAVHVWLDGAPLVAWSSAGNRPDVVAAFHNGSAHGFDGTFPVLSGFNHQVCVYAIDYSGGANSLVGCRTL
ncbi:peptidoglycan recognition protein family protein [Cellulomonas sp. P5_E12]